MDESRRRKAQQVIRRELEFVMLERRPSDGRELAVLIRAAAVVGLKVSQVMSVTGLSRQGVAVVKKREDGHLPAEVTPYVLTALCLAIEPDVEQLSEQLNVDYRGLEVDLDTLFQRGWLEHSNGFYVRPTAKGVEALDLRLEHRRYVELDKYSVYIALRDGERSQIEAGAHQVFPTPTEWVVIPAGTARLVTTDELAFSVSAESRRHSIQTAQQTWQEVLEAAGMDPQRQMQLADLIEPVRR